MLLVVARGYTSRMVGVEMSTSQMFLFVHDFRRFHCCIFLANYIHPNIYQFVDD